MPDKWEPSTLGCSTGPRRSFPILFVWKNIMHDHNNLAFQEPVLPPRADGWWPPLYKLTLLVTQTRFWKKALETYQRFLPTVGTDKLPIYVDTKIYGFMEQPKKWILSQLWNFLFRFLHLVPWKSAKIWTVCKGAFGIFEPLVLVPIKPT